MGWRFSMWQLGLKVKWSYLNIKKQKLEWKYASKQIDNPKGYICNPKKPKEMEKWIKEVFEDESMLDEVDKQADE